MSKSSEATDRQLLEVYNEVDAFLRQQFGKEAHAEHGYLIQEVAKTNRVVARHQQELRSLAQLRNNLVHNPFAKFADPIAYPAEEVVLIYAKIRDALLNPYDALSIAVPGGRIYKATLEDRLIDVVKTMDENTYTHVPIIQNEKMIGVFSENTLLSHLAISGEAVITDDMTIADFADLLPLGAHRNETFAFLPRKASLAHVFDIFNRAIRQHIRIGMVFVTENGREHETPLGIITAWDLANPEFEL